MNRFAASVFVAIEAQFLAIILLKALKPAHIQQY
jgi:hypothetical protein